MHRKGKNKKLSAARPYYHTAEDDDEYVQCSPCFSENKIHKYRKTTSSSTLKSHLVQKHSIDPDVEEAENSKAVVEEGEISEINTEAPLTFDQEILERAQKIVSIKTRKIRTYFFRLGDEEAFCCAFCIINGIKKSYKPTTSTSGLRRHMISAHQLDPLGYFRTEQASEILLNEEQLAESIAGTNKSKESEVWKYFCRKEIVKDDTEVTLDEDYIYCSLCWNAPVRQIHKYKNSTSSGALKRHLAARHGTLIENRRHRTSTGRTEDQEENSERQTEIYIEELDILPETQAPRAPSIPPLPQPPPKIQVQKYCRSCGKKDAGFFTKLSAVFDDADSDESEHPEQISLADMYCDITGIRVKSDDGMSQLVCYLCEANLKSAYKFRKIALDNESEMLRKLLLDPDEMVNYEELDEEYLEVEPSMASGTLEHTISDIETIYQSPPSSTHKKVRNKPRIITVIPKYKMKEEIEEKVVICQDESEEEFEVEDGQDLVTLQDFDIIEDGTEQVVLKRKKVEVDGMNFDEMSWGDMKKFISVKKRKVSEI